MILRNYKKGNCQAIFWNGKKKFVYKIPLSRKYDNNTNSISLNPKDIYKYFREEWRYQKNTIRFNNSIRILDRLEKISKNGLEEFFPETTIISVNRNEHIVGDKKYYYSGNMIKQELIDDFFDNTVSLQSFNWKEILNIEVELWKYGVGIGAPADTWGPKNWGKTNSNAVKLVDTSHLTENFKLVSKMLHPDIIEYRKKKLLSFNTVHSPHDIDQYFEYMSSFLNLENLHNKWGTYLN